MMTVRWKFPIFLLNFCLISRHVWSSRKSYPGAIFTKPNSRLKGYTFKTCVTPSQISCSQACLSNARCYSTNFKEIHHQREGICELNDEQSLDFRGLENYLHHEGGFIFSRFPKDDTVGCYHPMSIYILYIFSFFFQSYFVFINGVKLEPE